VSDSRPPPPDGATGASPGNGLRIPTPTLSRPNTSPAPISVRTAPVPSPPAPPAAPTQTAPVPPVAPLGQTGPFPAKIPTPPAPMNPYQSQVIPPAPFGGYPQAAPPPPGSQPRMGQTGTLPAVPVAAPPPVAPAAPPYPIGLPRITVQYPQVGSTLTSSRGSYQVRDVIGAGEFGAVYECIGPFDQIYALKMVRPANRPYSEVQAERAREQARLFTLRHPNVVYIYDSFEQGHLFYLALERCDHALKVMLGTPMQEGLVLEMTRQLLAAVQFLHDNDVVHDDLHAGNVLITHTDRPTVKISDFGISHELRGMPAVRPNVVHHAIMAPEILATGYTSKQSDLYQVGLLVYWMLVGEPAINMDVPYEELVRQVAEGEPRKRAEALGTPLGNLIAKMLRRREAFRYTSAREVWADLRELPAWKQRHLFPAK
jgi:serine/threonine-protein kinase